MSTQHITDPDYGNIPFKELRDLTLDKDEICVFEVDKVGEEDDDHSLCLIDRNGNCFWAYGSDEGIAHSFYRYGQNNVEFIIQKLQDIFGVELIDDYSDRYQELSIEEFEGEDEDSSSPLEQEYLNRKE
jgi:hypothetical protein